MHGGAQAILPTRHGRPGRPRCSAPRGARAPVRAWASRNPFLTGALRRRAFSRRRWCPETVPIAEHSPAARSVERQLTKGRKAMICAKCGNPEPEDAVYCSNCGSSLASQPARRDQAAWPGPDAVKTAAAPPPEATRVPEQANRAHEGYGPTQASGLPKTAAASSKGFLAALFDVGFNTFVTPKVVKVVYVLVMILTALWELALAVAAFKVNIV